MKNGEVVLLERESKVLEKLVLEKLQKKGLLVQWINLFFYDRFGERLLSLVEQKKAVGSGPFSSFLRT